VRQATYVLGDFIWTAIDYIGESSIGANGANAPAELEACGGYCPRGWDYHVSYCGDIDLVSGEGRHTRRNLPPTDHH
jgi:beta-galactosidase